MLRHPTGYAGRRQKALGDPLRPSVAGQEGRGGPGPAESLRRRRSNTAGFLSSIYVPDGDNEETLPPPGIGETGSLLVSAVVTAGGP